jgi:hypothetical protein
MAMGRMLHHLVGKHVVQFFVQYAPYEVDPKYGNWADDGFKNAFADRVFSVGFGALCHVGSLAPRHAAMLSRLLRTPCPLPHVP